MADAVPGSSWRPLKLAGALAALAIAGVAGSNAWAAIAAHGRSYSDLASVPSRTVAIVPGSRVEHGKPLAILRDRLEAARLLYQEGQVRAILVSGNDTELSPEVTVMRAWLRERGVPGTDIWTDERGWRTRETMQNAVGVHGVTDAVVCTQSLNMPRTLLLARAAGINAVGVELPTTLSRLPRFVGEEALKTTLATAESVFRSGPTVQGPQGATIAGR
jgi:vancomycin permeability regulator SanA